MVLSPRGQTRSDNTGRTRKTKYCVLNIVSKLDSTWCSKVKVCDNRRYLICSDDHWHSKVVQRNRWPGYEVSSSDSLFNVLRLNSHSQKFYHNSEIFTWPRNQSDIQMSWHGKLRIGSRRWIYWNWSNLADTTWMIQWCYCTILFLAAASCISYDQKLTSWLTKGKVGCGSEVWVLDLEP